ncbi:transposase [Gottfriedia acidiceleris]
MSKINRTSKKYSEDFKIRAVKLYLEGDKSYKTVAFGRENS